MRNALKAILQLGIAGLATAPGLAEPPSERTIVTATADTVAARVLIRWSQVEGSEGRFTHYEVRRRAANVSGPLSTLNAEPIGPLTTIVDIEALFNDPSMVDALAGILDSFGSDYASDILALQSPDADDTQQIQLVLLPDRNYAAALALGLGWMDDDVQTGETWVYEVWGLDTIGFPVERLGRASATVDSPPPITAPTNATCVEPGDERGHMAAFLRWDEDPATRREYIAGYDLYRAEQNSDGTCPPIGLGLPGVVKANRFPASTDSHGRTRKGETAFGDHCSSCHSGGRDAALPDNVAGKTLTDFRRLQYAELWDASQQANVVHDTNDLNGLSPETLEAVFDWIEEFHYGDTGADTPVDPLVEGRTYCYAVFPRNLLGQLGPSSPVVPCTVADREPPGVPQAIAAERVDQGGYEICEVSWERNAAASDDTVEYEVVRTTSVPRLRSELEPPLGPPPGWPKSITQPVAGARVTYLDGSQTAVDAGQPFFYAVRAVDDAGRRSDFSGWAPCVPRDLQPPPDTAFGVNCCDAGGDCAYRDDAAWIAEGEATFVADPRDCPVEVTFTPSGDAFGVRLYRSFDGVNYLPDRDCGGGPCPLDFVPSTDQKIWYKVRPYDASFNLGSESTPFSFLYLGLPLPPPRIVEVALVDEVIGRVEIRFRSLRPEQLLGFALYKEHAQAPGYQFVVRHQDGNLSTAEIAPGEWSVLGGAVPLSQVPGFIGPPAPASEDFLFYDDLEGEYVLNTVLGETSEVTLKLVAIGWSGVEGNFIPYAWDGWQPGDGFLDWPTFRQRNYIFWTQQAQSLIATHNAANGRMELSWTPHPDGCQTFQGRPFVVYRKRGGAARWEQISPPFVCTSSSQTTMTFWDTDVESGLDYTYTVLRTDDAGEFSMQYGPVTEPVP